NDRFSSRPEKCVLVGYSSVNKGYASSQSEGSNPSHPDSTTLDHFEDDLGHLHGSNGFADEGEMVATSVEHLSSFEGIAQSTPNEASKDQHLVEAMNNKMNALYNNNTLEITELPKGRKSIGIKWVFMIKYKSDGEIERYKARLVAKGFNPKEGIYFDETFSPVVKIVTFGCLINLVVQNS
nr:putative reverse transcriptase, RNA-dependent DNA polymerase, Gag-polypeptide of LTR copia-type [Tanacetum cinerariifolium]